MGVTLILSAHAQSIPQDRPAIRPPSALLGWADWEKGDDLLKRIQVPPAPVRTAAEEQATFKLAPGYRVELVAAEPLIHNPIFFEFDPDGRIWVVEYQGYMRDLAGTGEGDPLCRVVVLEDTDGDGRADRSTVFLDGLIMPRSFAFVKGGLLLQEPPHLWFCADTNGDLRCDQRTEVGTMGVGGNPQHTANGLRYGLDNWLHNADWPQRYQWREGKLVEAETIHRGQFGVTFDESGRFFTCYENKALHADYLPAEYLIRNPHLRQISKRSQLLGVNVDIATQAEVVFPIRVTPAVTLGALELREDGRLRTYTIVSGVCYYDGHQLPADAQRNVFIPESAGHLLGRLKLSEGIAPKATRFYPAEQEFFASTDERFRPVNARVGPDGALYVADLYHGIIEHVIFMVPWLTKQIEERHLEQGNDLGRLWRIIAEDRPIDRRSPQLAHATSAELVRTLGHPNGWHRLTAQRLLVERHDPSVTSPLRAMATGTNALGQLHALWTLDGLGALDLPTRVAAMTSHDERVRAAAVRLCERETNAANYAALNRLASDLSPTVRLQLVLTLGAFTEPQPTEQMATLLAQEKHALFRTAVLTGLAGRELEFLRDWLARPASAETDGVLISLLAQCVLEEAQPARVTALFEMFARAPAERRVLRAALLEAFASIRYGQPMKLLAEPVAITALVNSPEAKTREQVLRALNQFTWPGATPPSLLTPNAPPLTPEQAQRVRLGQATYATICAACHQAHGGGLPGVSPPLAGSDWVAGPPERIVRIVLQGLYGPVTVRDQAWNLHMPGLGASGLLNDEKIAGVLSYIRRAWGNAAGPVDPALVARVREETVGRTLPWRAEELSQLATAPEPGPLIKPEANGELRLPASQAAVFARKLAYHASLDVLGPWVLADDAAEWRVEVPAAGLYEVAVLLAADNNSAGNRFVLETEDNRVVGTVPSTGGFEQFQEFSVGRLSLRLGVNRLLLRANGPIHGELADFRAIRLIPVR